MKLSLILTCLTLSLSTVYCIAPPPGPVDPVAPVSPVATCATIRCASGTVCVDKTPCPAGGPCASCEHVGPPPPGPVTSCAAILCIRGSVCVEKENCPPGEMCASCVPIPSCLTHRCPSGEECYMQDVKCIDSPCYPQPACRPVAQTNPCDTFKCDNVDQECRVVVHPCFVPPCPEQAHCVDKIVGKCPFEVTDTSGAVCQYDRDCPIGLLCCQNADITSTSCQAPEPSPCQYIKCEAGQECVINSDVVCKDAPCKPVGECRPIVPEDPCNLIDCKPGDVCVSEKVECVDAPCPLQGKCIPQIPQDPCDRMRCQSGYVCVSEPVHCLVAPCPLQGKCVRQNKPGRCPRDRGLAICDVNMCRTDQDCKGDDKCCVNSCGSSICTRPATVNKRGRCPALPNMDLLRVLCVERADRCRSDGDCPGADKCCRTLCGMGCVAPEKPRKNGVCPVNTDFSICEIRADQCASDSDCVGNRKCCSDGCGRTCLRPKRVTKPGNCPSVGIQPRCFARTPDACTVDTDCPNRQKCCHIRCGKTCEDPVRGDPRPVPVPLPLPVDAEGPTK